ncbi:MAG: hypothetical protein A3I44_04245 [Candidatus Sungbacteria bacterium RIFCSPLOWO2_02_FULL_51_17]|uniref:Uncharacterized protein n=1 Tax=Candidatus Sungbacteria bacterium RIFCSPHIGHO2_02_FULL_51_29 TaxID=1802273 RepID=A0A1G2KYY2_9BACT|nr:MAG: hypothetical protein A2676_02755 [Candidatus Sungbacteria bacterium RIFCSPHIGHO2_01_FULL_51_22]OHA03691.1 MAG: hypothetical protein A3C16_03585 [Candidatus Sungbacteria bacterium RIFCSPHIGHO2_02_FULL_51_29]OHA07325.1 MAG: hypothetical protein A3B29_02850 [Candidatus Sungbacteria bacterium RIFCSPLOWO2_01_FULL_51_34]OHA11288.1 MAG: hypothetical protein A3I44_04245 [Candidatus Sungbacteria bacterium RIFCSPLOWO2_02_FULL_51_17]
MALKPGPKAPVNLSEELPRLMGKNNNCDARFEWQAIMRILEQEGVTGFDTKEVLEGITNAENEGCIEKAVRCTNLKMGIDELCFALTSRGFSKFGVEKR